MSATCTHTLRETLVVKFWPAFLAGIIILVAQQQPGTVWQREHNVRQHNGAEQDTMFSCTEAEAINVTAQTDGCVRK